MTDQGRPKKVADLLAAAGFPLTKFQFVDSGDGVEAAHAFGLAESLLRHLGQNEDAEKLREVSHAIGLGFFIERLSPETHALVTVMLQRESKRRLGFES